MEWWAFHLWVTGSKLNWLVMKEAITIRQLWLLQIDLSGLVQL